MGHLGHEGTQAIMALAALGVVALTIRSIAAVWMKRTEVRGHTPDIALTQQLARIESAVDAISLEVERISEAQRFSARLQAEAVTPRLPVDRPRS
ncbi:MAG: hypothetical protein ACREMS_10580 [Gemmatimonadaceae bacterium]